MVFTGFHRFKGSQQKSLKMFMMFLNAAPLLTLWVEMSQPYFLKRYIFIHIHTINFVTKKYTNKTSISPFLDLPRFSSVKASCRITAVPARSTLSCTSSCTCDICFSPSVPSRSALKAKKDPTRTARHCSTSNKKGNKCC